MPMIQVGASLPDGKQIQQSRKFKYSLWSFRLKQYDLSERMLKTAMFQMHLHVRYCYHAALLIRDSWELEKRIRGANRHLKYLSDRSGFGNKLLKTYESGDYEGTNVLG
ncbi:MAG: hypothetical protein NTY68_02575 [Candidatus Micrarchaeota archaeon]|nr:hypothetical protein [Candidatus Micrarchaeota archaeon]